MSLRCAFHPECRLRPSFGEYTPNRRRWNLFFAEINDADQRRVLSESVQHGFDGRVKFQRRDRGRWRRRRHQHSREQPHACHSGHQRVGRCGERSHRPCVDPVTLCRIADTRTDVGQARPVVASVNDRTGPVTAIATTLPAGTAARSIRQQFDRTCYRRQRLLCAAGHGYLLQHYVLPRAGHAQSLWGSGVQRSRGCADCCRNLRLSALWPSHSC